MNNKIISMIGITLIPMSMAFAQSDNNANSVQQPNVVQHEKMDDTQRMNPANDMPPSEIKVPGSNKEPIDMQPSSSNNTNIPTTDNERSTNNVNNGPNPDK